MRTPRTRFSRILAALTVVAASLTLQATGTLPAFACDSHPDAVPTNDYLVTVVPHAWTAGQAVAIDTRTGLELAMQADGNLVLYYLPTEHVLWASNTVGRGAFFQFQSDGNAVLYDRGSHPLWASGTNTAANTGSNRRALVLDGSGRLGVINWAGTPVWSGSSTVSASTAALIGSYFVYPGSTAYALMQTDGNLVVYRNGRATFYTGTYGHPHAIASIRKDFDITVTDGPTLLWSSHTAVPSCAQTCAQVPTMGFDGTSLLESLQPAGYVIWSSTYGRAPQFVAATAGGRLPTSAGMRTAPAAQPACCC